MANEMSANEVKYNKLQLLESQNQERMDKRNKLIVETGQLAGKIIHVASNRTLGVVM